MYLTKTAIVLALALCVQCKSIPVRVLFHEIEDQANILQDNREDLLLEQPFQRVQPGYVKTRPRRHTGTLTTNSDGSSNFNFKLPIAEYDQHSLSALGSVSALDDGKLRAIGGGLALDSINGHGLSLTGTHIPDFGNQLTAAGRASLLETENHRLGANAFITRNMPSVLDLPDFNTYGGGLDYMYKDKIGGSLGMSYTDLLQRKDYSAMGNLNLFRDRDSSLDMNAGFTKSYSPFMSNTEWQPSVGLTFTKSW